MRPEGGALPVSMVSGAGSEGGGPQAGAEEPGGSGARVRDIGPSRRVRPEEARAGPPRAGSRDGRMRGFVGDRDVLT